MDKQYQKGSRVGSVARIIPRWGEQSGYLLSWSWCYRYLLQVISWYIP